MTKRFLITTALEQTWRPAQQCLFLGEWCRLHSRKASWSLMTADVLPYHWDDRSKLSADFAYLQQFHERLLVELAAQLNALHEVDHSERYWRILIGPWLGFFIPMVFDRWTCLQQAVREVDLCGSIVLTGQEEELVPNGMADFPALYASDEWNHHICASVLTAYTTLPCIREERRPPLPAAQVVPGLGWKHRLKRRLRLWYMGAATALARDRDAFLLGTYLPLRAETMLQLRLRQFPQCWRTEQPVRAVLDPTRRQWRLPGKNMTAFEECARALIVQNIPTVYLEGYAQLARQAGDLPWPKSPQVIWTSNNEIADDVFKAWAAGKVEQGTPLLIGQHGGHYGVGRWCFSEEHEIRISDAYLSWGWTESAQAKVMPLGLLKWKRPLGVRHREQPIALMVTAVHSRYSYRMYSTPVAGQWLDYFRDQFSFVEHLPQAVRDALTVRLLPRGADHGWDQVGRWRARFPDVRLDEGMTDMDALLRRSRLYISTYNATTYLESFAMDVPTVIYWNTNHWELRDSALPFFAELKRVGIFHDTPQSAARHVAAIWDDVDAWWSLPEVREVLVHFKRRYCDFPDNFLGRIEAAIRTVRAVISERRATD